MAMTVTPLVHTGDNPTGSQRTVHREATPPGFSLVGAQQGTESTRFDGIPIIIVPIDEGPDATPPRRQEEALRGISQLDPKAQQLAVLVMLLKEQPELLRAILQMLLTPHKGKPSTQQVKAPDDKLAARELLV